MNWNWIILIVGGCFEVVFASSLEKMQQSTGKEFWLWMVAFLVGAGLSMFLLFKALGGENPIPVGTAYAVWGAIGAVGTVLVGIFIFKEAATFWRLFFLITLIISIVGLQITSVKS